MTTRTQTTLIVIGTLIVGMVLGGLIVGAVARHRLQELAELRTRPGLVNRLERVIQPTSDAQRDTVRAVLTRHAERIVALRRTHRRDLRAAIDSLRADLALHLTPEQQARLKRHIGRWRQRARRPRRPRRPME